MDNNRQDLTPYLTVRDTASVEYVEKKSVFIGTCVPISLEVGAQDTIKEIRAKYANATHNVFAYRLGNGGEFERFSDDGEPSGTAGMPVLSVMQKERVTNCAVIVTRYFGGIMLGAGGLVRAYSKAASLVLKEAGIALSKPYQILMATLPYSFSGNIRNLPDGEIMETFYTEVVTYKISVEVPLVKSYMERLMDATNGAASVTYVEICHFCS